MGITKLNKNIKANGVLIAFYIIIIYIVNVTIIAYARYISIFNWWRENNGSQHGCLDISSIALFNYSSFVFKLRQLFISGGKSLNSTEIQFIQAVALNQAKISKITINPVIPDDIYKDLGRSSFVIPRHLCTSITWGNEDIDIFRQGIFTYYGSLDNPPFWYKNWVDGGMPGPISAAWGVSITQNSNCESFWPSSNSFFGGSDTRYNLDKNLAKSVFNGGNNQDFYIPGNTDHKGSWAQLFADWGIIYTQDTSTSTSAVPIINTGSQKGSTSDINRWFNSGYNSNYNGNLVDSTNKSLDGSSFYGPNFFSVYYIQPDSYLLTSWVGDYYNDPTTGIILDPQSIPNLIGTGTTTLKNQSGGWINFLNGIMEGTISYNKLMNMLFASYQTNLSPKPSSHKCSAAGAGLAGGASFVSLLAMAALAPEAAPLVFLFALAGGGIAAAQSCIK